MSIKVLVPWVPPLDLVVPRIERAYKARWYTNFGQLVEELEARLAEKFFPGMHVVTTSSGTSALELSYRLQRAYGIHTALLSAWSFPAAALAAHAAGLQVRFRDVSPSTWSDGSVAALGIPVSKDLDDRPFVVDAAAAIGMQKALPEALLCFSMHATKPLPAIEGGFIVTAMQDEARELRRMTNFGYAEPTRTAHISTGHATSMGWGTNAKLSEFHAAVALAALDQWELIELGYLRLFDLYEKNLPPEVSVAPARKVRGIYPVLGVKLPQGIRASRIYRHLKAANIETRRWYSPPISGHILFRALCSEFPVTDELAEHVIGLPWHLYLQEGDIKEVCFNLASAIGKEMK